MALRPEDRPLRPEQRQFVEYMIYRGMTREEAYSVTHEFPMTEENKEDLDRRSAKLMFRPNVVVYYNALMEEVREHEIKKAVWTKEKSTETLMKLIAQAEQDIYGVNADGEVVGDPKNITMSRLNAIVLPVKELNQMHGYNQTNINMEGGVTVQIIGEDQLPE